MKSNYALIISFLAGMLLAGCSMFSSNSDDSSRSYTAVTTVSKAYTDSMTMTLSFTGLTKKNVYLADINPTATAISSGSASYITSSSGFYSDVTQVAACVSPAVSADAGAVSADSTGSADTITGICGTGSFHDITLPHADTSFSSSADLSRSASQAVTQITPVAGTTTKNIWLSKDATDSTYDHKQCTLRAAGTYCYVWIDDVYFSEAAGTNKASTAQAQAVADKFDALYTLERNIIGTESDRIMYYSPAISDFALEPMEYLSDTGTMVNIVLTDIDNDYKPNKISASTEGFFNMTDYFPDEADAQAMGYTYSAAENKLKYSNEGKYFYADTYFLNRNIAEIYSTLCHEFQHMVEFNMKTLTQKLSGSTWYKEMCSMLTEDIMQSYLGIADKASPKSRFSQFNQFYPLVGREWFSSAPSSSSVSDSDYVLTSYAAAYTFGAWICRQYGGAALLKEITHNSSVNAQSILAAVNSLNGTSLTMKDLVCQFAEACTFKTPSKYTLNQDAATTVSFDSYNYPMTACNLWDSANAWSNTTHTGYTSSDTLGPVLYDSATVKDFITNHPDLYTIRPDSFILQKVGQASSDTVTVTFSSGGSTDQVFVLMAQ